MNMVSSVVSIASNVRISIKKSKKKKKEYLSFRYPVVSYPWTFRTHFRSIRTQPSGRFVPKKLWHKMFYEKPGKNINIYFTYNPSNRKKLISNHRNIEKLSFC